MAVNVGTFIVVDGAIGQRGFEVLKSIQGYCVASLGTSGTTFKGARVGNGFVRIGARYSKFC